MTCNNGCIGDHKFSCEKRRCKDCHEYVTECNGTCAIPGPFTFQLGQVEIILHGPTPTEERAWLNHFARVCMVESVDIQTIAHNFCQLGIGDPSQLEDEERATIARRTGEILDDLWHCKDGNNWRAYNYAIWFVLKYTRGLEAMRKAIEEDMTKGDAEYGEIFLKSYGRDLLDNFLIERPKWV